MYARVLVRGYTSLHVFPRFLRFFRGKTKKRCIFRVAVSRHFRCREILRVSLSVYIGIDTLIRRRLSYLCHVKILSGSFVASYIVLSFSRIRSIRCTRYTTMWITIHTLSFVLTFSIPFDRSLYRSTGSRDIFVHFCSS